MAQFASSKTVAIARHRNSVQWPRKLLRKQDTAIQHRHGTGKPKRDIMLPVTGDFLTVHNRRPATALHARNTNQVVCDEKGPVLSSELCLILLGAGIYDLHLMLFSTKIGGRRAVLVLLLLLSTIFSENQTQYCSMVGRANASSALSSRKFLDATPVVAVTTFEPSLRSVLPMILRPSIGL